MLSPASLPADERLVTVILETNPLVIDPEADMPWAVLGGHHNDNIGMRWCWVIRRFSSITASDLADVYDLALLVHLKFYLPFYGVRHNVLLCYYLIIPVSL